MLKRVSIKLSTQFALLTTAMIVLVVLLMAQYTISMLNDVVKQSKIQSEQLNKSLAAITIESIRNKPSEYEIDQTLNNMLINNIIAYAIIEKNQDKSIQYSSIKGLTLKELLIIKSDFETKNIPQLLRTYQNTYVIGTSTGSETIYVGFYTEPILKVYVDLLINNLTTMVVLFIVMGLIMASLMSMIVVRPITKLISTIKKFAEGNLDMRASQTKFTEINELVDSYNKMADEIEVLYTSMEHKVELRTTELNQAYKELQSAQAMMVHSEKMKSLGELVAGITHEINNPVNFIFGNLIHLNNYVIDLMNLIDKYISYEKELPDSYQDEILRMKKDIDLDFLKTDLPDLIRSCREGTERTKNIVLDLKNFSRMDEMVINSVDLTKEIDTTLNILHNKFKNKIEVHKEYDENLVPIEGYGGQLNQVFMNILDNSAYAIARTGDIWIRMKTQDGNVILEFEDNGKGMDAETTLRIFDPFFTTKPPGEGTGLGMAISYKVIQNHSGSINVTSEVGKGTKFMITLPIKTKAKEQFLIKEEKEN